MEAKIKDLELQLEQKELELEELQSMFTLVIDTIPGRVFWKDRDCVYQGANKSFAQDAGVKDANSLIGKTDYDISWDKKESDYFRLVDQKVMTQNKEELGFIEPQRRPDGSRSWLETNKVPITNGKNEVIGILGTYHDITARIKHELAVEDSNRKLKIKNKELEQFAYMASHDLQEPLNTIIGFSQLLESFCKDQMDDSAGLYMGHILTATARMKDLIKGVLDYSRINAELKPSLINTKDMVNDVIVTMDHLIKEHNAILSVKEMPDFKGYEKIAPLLFQNLIGNAIKFQKPNVQPIIEVSGKTEDNYWQFEIKDNGIGIAEEHKNKIFQIFQRLHQKKEFQGSGIGLSHCKKVIELHNGEIWVKPNELGGSTFHFTIPFEL
ncbi:MAG: ATP-binding protein [Reichenbachiella sp.]